MPVRVQYMTPREVLSMSNLPFVEEILVDLRRFAECVEDGQDVDLDRDRLDLLTQLGLLERTQRSPALWVMTQAGEGGE